MIWWVEGLIHVSVGLECCRQRSSRPWAEHPSNRSDGLLRATAGAALPKVYLASLGGASGRLVQEVFLRYGFHCFGTLESNRGACGMVVSFWLRPHRHSKEKVESSF